MIDVRIYRWQYTINNVKFFENFKGYKAHKSKMVESKIGHDDSLKSGDEYVSTNVNLKNDQDDGYDKLLKQSDYASSEAQNFHTTKVAAD